ncbi:type III effector HrpK domain-containing protein [uncultured Methylobacterium sp.]|uniref:type III effector HrpK domain-containing protein n=1 Tax=uncultured Methylobacterium sp. TaxID=157278 RepID=UPI00259903C7|nr:type III effector HrpK domain-containing protein [uncultured Methylobacterium sp.]
MTSITAALDPTKRHDGAAGGRTDAGSADAAAWNQAQEQARNAGIRWEKPAGDERSAQEIIDGSRLLKDLGNQSGVKDMLKERAGDFDTDADAAYRATQILEHVERFDEGGSRIAGKDVDNGRIDGFTKGGDARHGTEAGRLQDFGKYGFSNLQGQLRDASSAADDPDAQQQAEERGLDWERPEGDTRSAQDIIDQSPLLKNLGNQSGVKDMLKERVGDYDRDADAAYRAMQVLDRVTMVDADGKALSGSDVANTSIDGFTKSGEARHGTEAGRLQDFGKYGFSALAGVPSADTVSSYKDFIDKNKDADETSKTFAKYAALIGQNFDAIRAKSGGDDTLRAEDLKTYAERNPQIGQDFKEALNFWSQPGAFEKLEGAKNLLTSKPDGNLSRDDVTSWISGQAPKDATSAMSFLSGVANRNTVRDVDTGALDKDIVEHPESHSTQEKAAALQDLLSAQELVSQGAAAGMWGDDYSKVSISNRARTNPDPKAIAKDIGERIDQLQSDPEVVKYLSDNGAKEIDGLLTKNPGLKDALQTTYDDIASGKALDRLWDSNTKDGRTDQQSALAGFVRDARLYQGALKIEPAEGAADIQGAVAKSQHGGDVERYYEEELASGNRLNDLLKDHPFVDAAGTFTSEVALYGSTLKPEFTERFDGPLNDAFTEAAREHVADGASFEDLKKAFGVEGSDTLDETQLGGLIAEVAKTNPEFLLNADGTAARPDQIIATFRGEWDLLRQGTKALKDVIDIKGSTGAVASDKGILHGVSGLMMAGITIARGAGSGGNLTERQKVDIAVGSVQTATLMAEGGAKAFKDQVKGNLGAIKDPELRAMIEMTIQGDVKSWTSNADKLENAAKGAGAVAGLIGGAYAIFDGIKSLRAGDKVGAGMSITSGALGVMAGGASAIESAGALLPSLMRTAALPAVAFTAGTLGVLSAGVGVLALLPSLIQEGNAQKRSDQFGSLLGDYLRKYEIDGVENGTIDDLPDSAWPEDTSVAS